MKENPKHIKPQSWLVVAGRPLDPGLPLNVPPILASNFIMGQEHAYSRNDGTASWEALEEIVGGLEGGKAVVFASGMAAIASVFEQLPVGAVIVIPEDCYQGVSSLAARGAQQGRWTVERVAVDDIVAVDNTFATPLNQKPLDFGATVSVQSATKFIGGHSDLLAGIVTTKDENI